MGTAATQTDIWPWAPYRCPRCCRFDTIPMPCERVWDHLASLFGWTPFKCRACRAKFHRRSRVAEIAPAPQALLGIPRVEGVRGSHSDPAKLMERLDNIIRVAKTQAPAEKELRY